MFATSGSESGLGDGRIDNLIIESSVHLAVGFVVVVAMTAATGLCCWRAKQNDVLRGSDRVVLVVAQVALIIQVLLGIKLLDQGQGIAQLYIHYVGGLIPLGAFLAGGWFARGDSPKSTKILAVMLAVGWLSALMAFVIGRAYVNG